MSPALDASANSARTGPASLAEDHQALEQVIGLYVQGAAATADPRISPLNAPAERLARFPPTLIQASSASSSPGTPANSRGAWPRLTSASP